MKTLSVFLLMFVATFEALASSCSNGLRTDFIKGVKSAVYTTEAVVSKEAFEFEGLMLLKEEVSIYPSINEVSDCLAAHAIEAAFPNCEDVFLRAGEFAASVKAGLVTVSDSSGAAAGDMGMLALAGTTAPLEVINYYKSYPGPTLNGGYFYGTANSVLELAKDLDGDGVADPSDRGGYQEMFDKLASITEKCNTAAGIPTYVDPAIDEGNKTEMAILDVYSGSTIACSFIVQIVNNEVRFEVKDEKLRKCVENSTAMIANIEQVDPITNELVSRKALGTSAEFVSEKVDEEIRISATEEDVESVNSIIDALDAGTGGINLGLAAGLKISDINFLDINSLDKTTLDIVMYCEYGAQPGDQADKDAFYALWASGDKTLAISPDNSWSENKANYYWAMYWGQLQNKKLYPILAGLHSDYAKGIITADNLWNWEKDALAMCYLNYPTYWIPGYIFDFIADGTLNDRTLIPTWYNPDSIFPEN